jgi:uncharacterized membrane protein YccC
LAKAFFGGPIAAEAAVRKKAINDEAAKMLRDYGQAAHDKACEAMRAAHRRRDARLERFLKKVAQEIERLGNAQMPSAARGLRSKPLDQSR